MNHVTKVTYYKFTIYMMTNVYTEFLHSILVFGLFRKMKISYYNSEALS